MNAISANCSNILSVDNVFSDNLRVYPNPTNGYVNFNMSLDVINVYDLSGKNVLKKTNSETINLENLKNGIYIIKVISDENYNVIKIIKN